MGINNVPNPVMNTNPSMNNLQPPSINATPNPNINMMPNPNINTTPNPNLNTGLQVQAIGMQGPPGIFNGSLLGAMANSQFQGGAG